MPAGCPSLFADAMLMLFRHDVLPLLYAAAATRRVLPPLR